MYLLIRVSQPSITKLKKGLILFSFFLHIPCKSVYIILKLFDIFVFWLLFRMEAVFLKCLLLQKGGGGDVFKNREKIAIAEDIMQLHLQHFFYSRQNFDVPIFSEKYCIYQFCPV